MFFPNQSQGIMPNRLRGIEGFGSSSSKFMESFGRLNFDCGYLSCSCQGDRDCNDMFSTDICSGSAVCTGSGSGTECVCLRY